MKEKDIREKVKGKGNRTIIMVRMARVKKVAILVKVLEKHIGLMLNRVNMEENGKSRIHGDSGSCST